MAAAAILIAAPAPLRAQDLELAVKAAYLPKLAPFVEWPDSAPRTGPMVICVVGQDRFGHLVDQAVQGHGVGARPLTVRRMARIDPGSGCHIAYLGGSREQSTDQAIRALRTAPVLTVTDQAGGARGIIHFVLSENRVRFRIDNQAARASGLRLSSKLLSLAIR